MKSIELKKWYWAHSPSLENSTWALASQRLSEYLFCKGTVIRCGQFLAAVLLAGGIYLLNLWSGDGVRLLVVLAAVSAFLYIGLAMQSRTRTLALLNLIAIPILFMTAYAGLNGAAIWLIVSFILHGSFSAGQLSAVDKDLHGGLFCWSVFNSEMALLLFLG